MSAQIALNVDCMEYMRTLPDKAFDLAIVDPPYFTGPERRGYYGCKVSPIGVHRDYPISPKWDVPGIDYFSDDWLEDFESLFLNLNINLGKECDWWNESWVS